MTMQRDNKQALKKNKKINFRARLAILFVIVSLALIALTTYLFYVGTKNKDRATINMLNQERYKSFNITARRGDIVDAQGTLLATSIKVYDVALDIKHLLSFAKRDTNGELQNSPEIDTTISALSEDFGIDKDSITAVIKEKPESRYQILIKGVSQKQKDEFESRFVLSEIEIARISSKYEKTEADAMIKDLKEAKSKQKDMIQGVILEDRYIRSYPYKSLASNVIGFCDNMGEGVAGIEKYYNDVLTGKNGRRYTYMDSSMLKTSKEEVPIDGNKIMLTLDMRYQRVIEKQMKRFKESHLDGEGHYGAKNLAMLVMDPRDGSIKAMATNAGYDLNNPRDLLATGIYKQEDIDSMNEKATSDALNSLWRNYCVSEAYEPGSTFKPILLSYAIDSGAVSLRSHFNCGGHLKVADRDIKCSSRNGHGNQSLGEALCNSCNVAFMQIGFKIKKEGLEKAQNLFNFGLKTGIDLPDEVYTYNSIRKAASMNITDLATNSFGQNFDVSMIQLSSAFSSIINGGTYFRPRTVQSITDTYNNTTRANKPVVLRKTVSGDTSERLKDYLHTTVKSRKSKEELNDEKRIEIGGKTGTAEKLPRDKRHYLISFIGFTPIEEPALVCYVVIDEPNVPRQDNSKLAMELGKETIRELNKIK